MKEIPFSAGIIITQTDLSGSRGIISLRKPEDINNRFQEYLTICQEGCRDCDPGDNVICESMNPDGKAFVTIQEPGTDMGVELDKHHTPCTKYGWTSNHK